MNPFFLLALAAVGVGVLIDLAEKRALNSQEPPALPEPEKPAGVNPNEAIPNESGNVDTSGGDTGNGVAPEVAPNSGGDSIGLDS